jgi:hypothetical protein
MVNPAVGYFPSLPPVKLCSTVRVCACAGTAAAKIPAQISAIAVRKLMLKIEVALRC